jgi:hypothetical protein
MEIFYLQNNRALEEILFSQREFLANFLKVFVALKNWKHGHEFI